jgi:glycolate oxidase iron-sulfur subunit
VVLALFARPTLLAVVLAASRLARATRIPRLLARVLPGRLGFACAMLASTEPPVRSRRWTPRPSGARGTATLLEGCVMRGLFRHTNAATRRVLRENDYRVVDTGGQRCCGALHAHAGDLATARALARANVAAFERVPADFIATNSAGCGAMMKDYGDLLAGEPEWAERARAVAERVRDVSELLADAGPKPAAGRVDAVRDGASPVRVTYDAPCHLLHAQRIASPPLAVLRAVGGIDFTPLADADQCCGSAGIYNLVEPETSDAVLTPKLRHIAESGATLVATGNPGCLMQLGAGLARSGSTARAVHPVDLLDAAYAAAYAGAHSEGVAPRR